MRTVTTTVICLFGLCLFGSAEARQKHVSTKLEAEILKVLDDYMDAWNRKDLEGWERTFNFPHFRLASGRMAILDHPGMQDPARVWGSVGSDWHHSKWDRRRIIHASEDKAHVDTQFTRYRADGSKIGTYESCTSSRKRMDAGASNLDPATHNSFLRPIAASAH